jgi:hypothetical protein
MNECYCVDNNVCLPGLVTWDTPFKNQGKLNAANIATEGLA